MEFELTQIIPYVPYGLVGLGAIAVGIKKYTNLFPPKKCPMTTCPDPECQGNVKALKKDVSEMKPQLLNIQKSTSRTEGQVDMLVKKFIQES